MLPNKSQHWYCQLLTWCSFELWTFYININAESRPLVNRPKWLQLLRFFFGLTALYGPGPPRFVEVSWSHTFETHHIRQDSSGRVTSPSQRRLPDFTQHSQETDIHAPRGIFFYKTKLYYVLVVTFQYIYIYIRMLFVVFLHNWWQVPAMHPSADTAWLTIMIVM
jgi:hypothetical protein